MKNKMKLNKGYWDEASEGDMPAPAAAVTVKEAAVPAPVQPETPAPTQQELINETVANTPLESKVDSESIADLLTEDDNEYASEFEEFNKEFDAEPAPEEPTPTEEVEAPAVPEVAEAPLEELPTPPIVQEEVPPVSEEEVTPPPEVPEIPQEAPAPVLTEAELAAQAEQKAKLRSDFEAELANNLYNLTEDDSNMMLTEPEKVVPGMMAKMHAQILENAVTSIMANIPNVVEGVLKAQTVNKQYEDSFYGKWPKLKGQDQVVKQVGSVYRQLNPKATAEEAVQAIGMQAMLLLGLTPDQPAAQRTPEVPEVPPHVPAQPGGGVQRAPTPPAPHNPYADLAEDFLREDID